jgi:hypothetical protein
MVRSCPHSQVHQDASTYVEHLRTAGGVVTDSNPSIAEALGMPLWRLLYARRHTMHCAQLGGATIAHRKRGQPVVLVTPLSSTLAEGIPDRTAFIVDGWHGLADAFESVCEQFAAVIDRTAAEATQRGEHQYAVALGYIATDVRAQRAIQPVTITLLQREGLLP